MERTHSKTKFPVVGIGASAGGLEALRDFCAAINSDSGMAFVVVMHLSPDKSSSVPHILDRVAPIPVVSAEDGVEIEPNKVYVIPPGSGIELRKGRVKLTEPKREGKPLAIDNFFDSLAEECGSLAAGIVLSGAGTDGSNGIKKIKAGEGLVLVQAVEGAQYTAMPQSALSTGVVDLALEPSHMPATLIRHFFQAEEAVETEEPENRVLPRVFTVLRQKLGHDFAGHKETTLRRRLHRRMVLHEIEEPERYVQLLRDNLQEAQALFREFLIGVTHFFRDPDAFSVLKEKVLPKMVRSLPEGETFRVWVPGCSTGEEAFSVAILLREVMEAEQKHCSVQLFATDLDEQAIEVARGGQYPLSIASDVSEERLQRFFSKDGNHYRVRKEIRDTVVFSVQDLLSDPPFSRLRLLCCRNVLIYLKPEAQKKLLPLFHYTLKPDGVMLLGSSESIGSFTHLFDVIEQKQKLFRKKDTPPSARGQVHFPTGSGRAEREESSPSEEEGGARLPGSTAFLTQQLLLEEFGPDAVLVEGDGSIVYVQGKTGKYLEAVTGPATSSILDLARPGLRLELASALRAARTKEETVVRHGVSIQGDDARELVDLYLVPVREPSQLAGRFLVVFDQPRPAENGEDPESAPATDGEGRREQRISELEAELRKTQESHQSTVEELQSANEELKSTNEELQSANEELQSTNEEHESSKEELQSLNEELNTSNSELEHKIGELQKANDDIRNFFNSTEVASVFLDGELKVRRFTEEAKRVISLIDSDVGRPLSHLVSNLKYEGLQEDLLAAAEKLETREREVQTAEGVWYKMRVFPYRTEDNRIDGAVLTFVNINDQKQAQERLEEAKAEGDHAWQLFRAVFDMNPQPLVVLDEKGDIVVSNTAFAEAVEMESESLEGSTFSELAQTDKKEGLIADSLNKAFHRGRAFRLGPVSFYSDGEKRYNVSGTVVRQDEGEPYRILLKLEEPADE